MEKRGFARRPPPITETDRQSYRIWKQNVTQVLIEQEKVDEWKWWIEEELRDAKHDQDLRRWAEGTSRCYNPCRDDILKQTPWLISLTLGSRID